jgi:hypothetical protein
MKAEFLREAWTNAIKADRQSSSGELSHDDLRYNVAKHGRVMPPSTIVCSRHVSSCMLWNSHLLSCIVMCRDVLACVDTGWVCMLSFMVSVMVSVMVS